MAHDVFISYSSRDKPIADAVCANLEAVGVRCWFAPRDIAPGEDWPTAITKAISQSRVMVLVFSANSNSSEDVSRELFLAANNKLVIIPFKIENIEPEPGKQYYLARTHWLDAINPPTQEQIRALIECVKALIPAREPALTVEAQPAAAPEVKQPIPLRESSGRQMADSKKPGWTRLLWLGGILLVILCLVGIFGLAILTHIISLPSALSAPLAAISPKARIATTTTTANKPTAAKSLIKQTSTPDFRAMVGISGINLYSGPGENYAKIDFVYIDYVTIVGQVNQCSWLKVEANTGSRLELGWVMASKVTYSIACSTIKLVDVPTLQASASIPTSGLWVINILDDFSSNIHDWPTWINTNDTCSNLYLHLQNGGLFWKVDGLNGNNCVYFATPSEAAPIRDFDVSVDVQPPASPAQGDGGIVFRARDVDNFYLFVVNDGSRSFTIRRNQPNDSITWKNWTMDQAIRSGQVNHLAVSGRGSHFTFSINGKPVADLDDDTNFSGSVGVGIDVYNGASISLIYDNFELHGDY